MQGGKEATWIRIISNHEYVADFLTHPTLYYTFYFRPNLYAFVMFFCEAGKQCQRRYNLTAPTVLFSPIVKFDYCDRQGQLIPRLHNADICKSVAYGQGLE